MLTQVSLNVEDSFPLGRPWPVIAYGQTLLQGRKCAFRDAILHSLVVTSAYLSCQCPSVKTPDNELSETLRPANNRVYHFHSRLETPFFSILTFALSFSESSEARPHVETHRDAAM